MNPLFSAFMMQPLGIVSTQAMLIDDHEFWETRFYREWCKPQRYLDTIFFKILKTDQRIGWWAAHRLEGHPRYGDADVRLVTLLSPHVCRAITISDALNLETVRSEALEATPDALASGVYLTDRHGRIIYMNRAAECQVKARNALRIENDRLTPVDRPARAALAKAIDEAITDEAKTPGSGLGLTLPETESAGLIATILPLYRGERRNVCGALPRRQQSSCKTRLLCLPFLVKPSPSSGLTGSELRVLLVMAPGLSVKEAAEVLGVGETTAKTHLQHIYSKTGTELMHLFMSSTPPVNAYK
jgi:DNA-binding CsgD family transcriptional regulator